MNAQVIPIRAGHPALTDDAREWSTGPEVCVKADITYRQLDHWTRTGLLVPTGDTRPGFGNYRRYSPAEVDKARAVSALLRAGLHLPTIRKHIDQITTTGRLTKGPVTITYIPEK